MEFELVKRGYDPEAVNKHISTLMQVIKSYKEKDNAIKNAIISAQVAADNMLKNARLQAEDHKNQINQELEKIRQEVERQRMRLHAFQDVYTGLVRKYLTTLEDNDMVDLHNRLDDIDRLIVRLIDSDVMPMSAGNDSFVTLGFSDDD